MSFATDLDQATLDANSGNQQALRDAFTAFQTAVASVQTTYGSPAGEVVGFKDQLLRLAKDVSFQMRGEKDQVDTLLFESGLILLLEDGLPLLLE